MKTLRLIDLSGIYWRHWHGSKGKESAAPLELTMGTVRKLADVPDVLHGIALDAGDSGRKAIWPGYKADRPDKDPAAMDQLRTAQEKLAADGYKILRAEGFEADDVIASAVQWVIGQLQRTQDLTHDFVGGVDICSSDKDLVCLINDQVSVVNPFDGTVYGRKEVETKFGVPPVMMSQWLSLVGDKSDNIPGVRGIGAVHAAKLLSRYGSISGILSAADDPTADIPPAIRKALIEGVAAIELSSKLVALRTDAPCDFASMLTPREVTRVTPPVYDASFEDAPQAAQVATMSKQTTEATTSVSFPQTPADATSRPAEAPTEPATSTALAVVQPKEWTLALEPDTPREAYKMAQSIFEGRLFPAFGNPDAVFTIILTGRSMGLSAMASLRGIQMIKGKPSLSADLLVGLVRASPLCRFFRCVETTPERATYRTQRTDEDEPINYTFTIDEARSRGFTFVGRSGEPAPWATNPRGMLRAAAKRELARMVYEEVVGGICTPEELE